MAAQAHTLRLAAFATKGDGQPMSAAGCDDCIAKAFGHQAVFSVAEAALRARRR